MTLQKKVLELSRMCGESMSLLVKDSKFNKIIEYHTDEEIKIGTIMEQIGGHRVGDNTTSSNTLKVFSVDVNRRFRSEVFEESQQVDEVRYSGDAPQP